MKGQLSLFNEEYDPIAILLSGGKDSIACYYKLLELGVPKEKMEF